MNTPKPIFDSFFSAKTKNILYGNYVVPPNDYVKNVIVSVIKSYTQDCDNISPNEWGKFFNNLSNGVPNYNYDDIISHMNKSGTENPSTECVLASAFYGYKDNDPELITRCLNTFCRPVQLKGKEEWLDNWSLNGPGNALNFVFWNKYNSPDVIAISKDYEGISHNNVSKLEKLSGAGVQSITKFDKIVTQNAIKSAFRNNQFILKVVGIFRVFLICNNLLPPCKNERINKLLKQNTLTDYEIMDICVEYFPFYYLGCGGCDMFDGIYAANMNTVKEFLSRYPGVSIGSIINVSTFSSGDGGSHWMGLYNVFQKAYLMCPQASNWDIMGDNGTLYNKLLDLGFSLENNVVCCQQDRCNCGVYSLLFLFTMLLKNGNMKEAVQQVGINANNLKTKENNESGDNRLIYVIKKTLFGY